MVFLSCVGTLLFVFSSRFVDCRSNRETDVETLAKLSRVVEVTCEQQQTDHPSVVVKDDKNISSVIYALIVSQFKLCSRSILCYFLCYILISYCVKTVFCTIIQFQKARNNC